MADKYLNPTGLQAVKNWIIGKLTSKMNLVATPTQGEILTVNGEGQAVSSGTDLDSLLFDVEAGKSAFMLYDFNIQGLNLTIPRLTDEVTNTGIPNVDISLSAEMAATWAIASLAKYEAYNGSARQNVVPVCSFSMDGQKTLRLRMMCAGTTTKKITRLAGAVLLKHR